MTFRTFDPRYRGDHPMFAAETCDRCRREIGPADCTYEHGKEYLCRDCYDRYMDEEEVARDGER